MKIPTLLGIALIITLIALIGLFYYYYTPPQAPNTDIQVTDLKALNISATTTTIVWQTPIATVGEVLYDTTDSLSQKAPDNRDRISKRARMVHFVTLNNLKPDTVYNYKINNDNTAFPKKSLQFKTASFDETNDNQLTFSFDKPLKGTILNVNLNPIDESLIFLDIPGAQPLATFSSTAGNFIMPLKTVLNKDLNKRFVISPDTPAQLTIVKGSLKSDVKIVLSEDNINLPPITIGSSLDLQKFENQPIKQITFSTIPSIGNDFNGDQKVNSIDLALLKEAAKPSNAGNTNQSNYDINKDGVVDEEDINQFSKALNGH